MNIGDEILEGTELKYAIEISSPGFQITRDNFEIDLHCGENRLHFNKSELPFGDDGKYYLCFDSSLLGPGNVTAIITAHVPDNLFSDHYRDEITSFHLTKIRKRPVK